jgi:Ca2+-binding EF-hand superfamily protein
MIVLQKGKRNLGRWIVEERNILDDYRRAFGADPPAMATLGIMNDSDNTKEASVSYVGFIEVYR